MTGLDSRQYHTCVHPERDIDSISTTYHTSYIIIIIIMHKYQTYYAYQLKIHTNTTVGGDICTFENFESTVIIHDEHHCEVAATCMLET